jgi:hypothetical protein
MAGGAGVNEPLDHLLTAYRAEPVDDGAARVTRARVLANHARRTRMRPLRAFGWFAGALLCGSSAMAAVSNATAIVAHVSALFTEPSAASRPARRAVAPTSAHVATPVVAQQRHAPPIGTAPGPTPTPPAEAPARTAHDAAARAERNAERRPRIGVARRPSAANGDADVAAFERAHRLHFAGGEPRATIAAWSSYLARFPRGRFTVEARYNLAIAYVREGDIDAACSALQPFATGEHGSYRRREARALLHALREDGSR